ncbi:hypothetical protein BDV93DRAFT_512133 [Ceratobasidium sp. AG-I]|nr:hypothetical protein BDV93DRAFT_512133 [Ceratobasidium sp. AG-I]
MPFNYQIASSRRVGRFTARPFCAFNNMLFIRVSDECLTGENRRLKVLHHLAIENHSRGGVTLRKQVIVLGYLFVRPVLLPRGDKPGFTPVSAIYFTSYPQWFIMAGPPANPCDVRYLADRVLANQSPETLAGRWWKLHLDALVFQQRTIETNKYRDADACASTVYSSEPFIEQNGMLAGGAKVLNLPA